MALPEAYAAVLGDYTANLARAPVSAQTRRTYASKVRQFLVWLQVADTDGDPLREPAARDWAVRDYRTHLQAVAKRAPATVNNALAAVDDFYTRLGLGPAHAKRAELPQTAPRALGRRVAVKFLREVQRWPSPRDKAVALVPFYAGARISEVVGLDVEDVAMSARKGTLRIYGKGQKVREVPIHPPLRAALAEWLGERPDWPGSTGAALFLNQKGGRLSATSAHTIITTITESAGIQEKATAHTLRHTFATSLVRAGTDLVTVAELLGHARLDNVRVYSQPTEDDKIKALDNLITDE
ncbi:MAG: tyrosine-type recombinase/integrase [Pseudonocardiaceae bacterium]